MAFGVAEMRMKYALKWCCTIEVLGVVVDGK
jgi:hypothetical protein